MKTSILVAESFCAHLMTERYLSDQTLKQLIAQAVEEGIDQCLRIADDVERESASLILNPDLDETEKEYYRGRGLAAAAIAKRIAELKR